MSHEPSFATELDCVKQCRPSPRSAREDHYHDGGITRIAPTLFLGCILPALTLDQQRTVLDEFISFSGNLRLCTVALFQRRLQGL